VRDTVSRNAEDRVRTFERITRHARLSWMASGLGDRKTPPFLILFINSVCNLKCAHCFYWRSLNRRDDLTLDEIRQLADELGPIENLNLSGGEPFIRREFAEICRYFIRNNGVKEIYVPTNGWFAEKTVKAVEAVLEESALRLLVCELSVDGTEPFHDELRGVPGSFRKLIATYDRLAEVQAKDPRLRVHATSTATNRNIEELRQLTTWLYARCPAMDHHNLAIIRGDRRDPSLLTPESGEYDGLYEYIQRLWAPREAHRYGALGEPILQWAKHRALEAHEQPAPCRAGIVSAVVYANGDVSFCELHEPIGNLREKRFTEIWSSAEADRLRERISARKCWCTTEVFLWPSVAYQPVHLARALLGCRAWRKPRPLDPEARATPETTGAEPGDPGAPPTH
jgi:MoaA/NifB/PqqE/SkfB family radical SAM enzyme